MIYMYKVQKQVLLNNVLLEILLSQKQYGGLDIYLRTGKRWASTVLAIFYYKSG